MALTAARTDLTIALVGEDETVKMLEEAKARMAALEERLKSLKTAGNQQAAAAKNQTSAFANANKSMAGFAKGAEGLVEGLDRGKSAFDKITGALGFWGTAVSGAVALGGVLVSAFSDLFTTVDRQAEAFNKLTTKIDTYTESLKTATIEAKKFSSDSVVAAAGVAAAELALAKKRGDEAAIAQAEIKNRNAEAAVAKQTADRAFQEAEATFKRAESNNDVAKLQLKELEEEIRKRESTRSKEFRSANFDAAQRAAQEKAELEKRRGTLEAAVRESDKAFKDVEKRFNQAQELHRKSVALAIEPAIITLEETEITRDPRPTGGSGRRTEQSFDDFLADLIRQGQERRRAQEEIAREDALARQERQKAREEEAKAAVKALEEQKKLLEQQAALARAASADPVIDFANVLSSNLTPALSGVEQAMGRVMELFTMFKDGQASLTTALEGSAQAIGGMVAEYIGGVKGRAAWDAAYHLYKGFGTMFTNPAESAGHFIAATGLGLVAAGVIPSGTSGGKKPATASPAQQRQTGITTGGAGGTVNNYTLNAGVVDGQSTTRAFRRAELASRNTGFAHAGGW